MEVKTHSSANPILLGKPVWIRDDVEAIVELETTEEMIVDNHGLIHGGFTFGLADYAVMLAVNHPNVVLGASQVSFLAPVKLGDVLKASANVVKIEGRRREVEVEVSVDHKTVLSGIMTCYILDRHVLEK